MSENQRVIRISTAMQKLDVSRSTIYRLIKSGTLEAVKIGRSCRITESSIMRVISNSTM